MYMGPIVKASEESGVAPSHPALRRAVGVPVLVLAAVVALPWMAAQGLVALGGLAVRGGLQAVDYAGTVALGR